MFFKDVSFKETTEALKGLDWNSEGKFVRVVLESVASMGFTSKVEIEKLLKKEVYASRKLSMKMLRAFFLALFLNLNQNFLYLATFKVCKNSSNWMCWINSVS
jgi:hypothetical protein